MWTLVETFCEILTLLLEVCLALIATWSAVVLALCLAYLVFRVYQELQNKLKRNVK